MDNSLLYENTIKTLLDLLQDTVNNFNRGYDTLYNFYNSQPLFLVATNKLKLLENIENITSYQIKYNIAELCKTLCINSGIKLIDCNDTQKVDFIISRNDVITGYKITMKEEYMPDIPIIKNNVIDKYVYIVLKTKTLNFPPTSLAYRNYPYREKIENVTLETFFDDIAPGEYAKFKEYIGKFNYEAELLTGLTITPLPTKTALSKKHEKIISEFDTFFYEDYLSKSFNDDEIQILKKSFNNQSLINTKKTSYIDSFISSEWHYDLLIQTDGELEQTAIVAGYLKSVEQLLFSLMLSRCDSLRFKLYTKKTVENEGKLVILSRENKDSLLTMAGSLLSSIDINYQRKNKLDAVYINSQIGEKVQSFLHMFFKHTRNGYFHKDNIYNIEEIKQIRKETYCAYFLLVSSFIFDENNIN